MIYFIPRFLLNEINANWHFVKRDILAVVLPGSFVTLCALLEHPSLIVSFSEKVVTLALSVLYFWLALTFFCISNQLTGIEEDKINKPDRPIPSELISPKRAQLSCFFSVVGFLLLGLHLKILGISTLLLVSGILHNIKRLGDHWLTKNLLVSVGMFLILAAGYSIAITPEADVWKWITFLAVAWFFLAHVQDLRDIEGDQQVGRRTFPIVFGESFSRHILSSSFFIFPFIMIPSIRNISTVNSSLYFSLLFFLSWAVAARILLMRTRKADDSTYAIFISMYFLMIVILFFPLHVLIPSLRSHLI